MVDIFLSPLESITWDDILVFLALDRPPGERPAETARLELKRQMNAADIARTIAAMANSDGGLILVGVLEDKASSRPTGLHPDPGLDKKIIRVAVGDDPPYCVSEHGVKVRLGAVNAAATRREIERPRLILIGKHGRSRR